MVGRPKGVDGAASYDDEDWVARVEGVVDDEVARGWGAAGVVKREQEAKSPAESRAMTPARLVLTPILLVTSTTATIADAVKTCSGPEVIVISPEEGTQRAKPGVGLLRSRTQLPLATHGLHWGVTPPEDIAQAALYLASEASAVVISTTFSIDAGLRAYGQRCAPSRAVDMDNKERRPPPNRVHFRKPPEWRSLLLCLTRRDPEGDLPRVRDRAPEGWRAEIEDQPRCHAPAAAARTKAAATVQVMAASSRGLVCLGGLASERGSARLARCPAVVEHRFVVGA